VGLVLLGFGVRAGFDHAMLRDRDGGAPLFSQDALRAQGIRSGLLFVDTDAAFDLAFDPDARAATGVEVVRSKGGAFDALTWRARGSPEPAFVARFVTPPGGGRGSLEVRAYSPPITADAAIDAGALWPPRAQEGGAYALPVFAGGTCAAAERPLRVLATANGGAVRIGVPPIFASGRVVDIGLIVGPGSAAWRASLGAPSSAALVAAGPSSPSPSALVAAGPSSPSSSALVAAGPSSPSPAALVAPSSSAAGPSPPSLSALVAPSSSAGLGASVDVALEVDGVPLARGRFALPFDGDPRCLRALSVAVPAGARRVDIRVTAGFRAPADPELQPLVALDRIVARSAAVPGPPPPEGP
jgi:hypothetical protein